MCTCDHKRQHFNIGASRVFACAMEVSLALTDFYWFGSACRISLLSTFFMVLFLMTVGSRVVARVSSMCQTVIFQSEIKLNGSTTNAKDVSELFLFFVFASQRSRLCVFRIVDRVWPSTEWSLDPSVFGSVSFRERMRSRFESKRERRNDEIFGCPRHSIEMLANHLRTASKLIYDSPANLSLTAWWASAAGCNGGRAHVSGVLCGGTRNTCPGLYSGYDEYNALAVE